MRNGMTPKKTEINLIGRDQLDRQGMRNEMTPQKNRDQLDRQGMRNGMTPQKTEINLIGRE